MLSLTAQADLATMYTADVQRYAGSDVAEVVSIERFVDFYAGCESIGFDCDGQPIGGILFDGEEAHIAVLPEHHGRWALLLKPALAWLFSLKQEILVHVERDNLRCIRFLQRHGWQVVDESGDDFVYRLVPQGGLRKTDYRFRPGQARSSSYQQRREAHG